jgi:cytosine/adenosine deaminase-related metal-dependent hydrolase
VTREIILRNGAVLLSEGIAQVDLRVSHGRIAEIDTAMRSQPRSLEIDCSGYFIYPGLINSHDHLEFNLYSHLGDPPYRNAYEWGHDLHKRWRSTIEQVEGIPLRYRLWWGAWKNLFSGVTTVVHHNRYYAHFRIGYPVDVLRRYTFAHSLEFDRDIRRSIQNRKRGFPFIIHLAEGTDEESSLEVKRLDGFGGIDGRTVAVHAVGLSKEDVQLLIRRESSVVWCPSSNQYLFNRTMPIKTVFGNIPLALGTDSTLTGSESLFDELRVARRESSLTPRELFSLVTRSPRQIFNFPSHVGDLKLGGNADLFLLPVIETDPYKRILSASPQDIALLMKKGKVVYYNSAMKLKEATAFGGHPFPFRGGSSVIVRSKTFAYLFSRLHSHLSHYSYLNTMTLS